MGTRTAPRKKTKRIQRKKQRFSRRLTPIKVEKQVETATSGEGEVPLTSSETVSELAQGTVPTASPVETAQAWARENETSSTIKQVAAAALICGQKVSKTATALGVDRRTIQRWQKLDPEFQLAMVETKQEVVLSSRQYLLALAEEAVNVVESKLAEEQNTQVALSLLRGIGVLSPQSAEARLREEVQAGKEFCAQTATLDEAKAEENELPPSLQTLPPTQQLAIGALYEGKTLSEAAPIAGTSEATLRSWVCGDKPFFEVLSGLQFDRMYHLKYRLLTLTKQAMQIIHTALSKGNGRVALSLLRGFGVMR